MMLKFNGSLLIEEYRRVPRGHFLHSHKGKRRRQHVIKDKQWVKVKHIFDLPPGEKFAPIHIPSNTRYVRTITIGLSEP